MPVSVSVLIRYLITIAILTIFSACSTKKLSSVPEDSESNGRLLVGGLAFDPLLEKVSFPKEFQASLSSKLFLIQGRSSSPSALRRTLIGHCEVLKEFPGNAVVAICRDAAVGVTNLPEVRYVGHFDLGFKLAEPLRKALEEMPNDQELDLWIVVFKGASLKSVETKIKAFGGALFDSRDESILTRITKKNLIEILNDDQVFYVEEYHRPTDQMDRAILIGKVPEVWVNGISRLDGPLSGHRQIISTIGELGFDNANLCTSDNCNVRNSKNNVSSDFKSTVAPYSLRLQAIRRPEEDPNQKAPPTDTSGHGTLVADVALGSGQNSTQALHLPAITGVAPDASLVVITQRSDQKPFSFVGLITQASMWGARIHNISQGYAPNQFYTKDEYDLDHYLSHGKSDEVIVVAAGNEGPKSTTLSSPGRCKNCIVVANSENEKPSAFLDSIPPKPNEYADNRNHLHYSSSSGPAWIPGIDPNNQKRRLKPDLAAPGSIVAAVRSSKLADPIINAKDATPPYLGNISYPSNDSLLANNYLYKTGSSISAPYVAGVAALAREYLQKTLYKSNPDEVPGHLVKALVLHRLRDMYLPRNEGDYKCENAKNNVCPNRITDHIPNYEQGWGLVSPFQSFFGQYGLQDTVYFALYTGTNPAPILNNQTQKVTYEINVLRGHPLHLTLAWYDPAEVTNPALKNDLNLSIYPKSRKELVFRGGVPSFANGVTIVDGPPDDTNTVEEIRIPNPPEDGTYVIEVSKGPQFGDSEGDRPFSLVVSGDVQAISCDNIGIPQNLFMENKNSHRSPRGLRTPPTTVYVRGKGLPGGKKVDVYVIPFDSGRNFLNPEGVDLHGLDIRTQPYGNTISTFDTTADGKLASQAIWINPRKGRYNIVIDVDRDGAYTPGKDLVDATNRPGFYVMKSRETGIVTARASGKEASVFQVGEQIYVKGANLPTAKPLNLYVVKGFSVPENLYGLPLESLKINKPQNPLLVTPVNGAIFQPIWNNPNSSEIEDTNFFNLVLDVDGDGLYYPDTDITDHIDIKDFISFLTEHNYQPYGMYSASVKDLKNLLNRWFDTNLAAQSDLYDENTDNAVYTSFATDDFLPEEQIPQMLTDLSSAGFSVMQPNSVVTTEVTSGVHNVEMENFEDVTIESSQSHLGISKEAVFGALDVDGPTYLDVEQNATLVQHSHKSAIEGYLELGGHLSSIVDCQHQTTNLKASDCVTFNSNSSISMKPGGTFKIIMKDELKKSSIKRRLPSHQSDRRSNP